MSHPLLICNHCGGRKPQLTPEQLENYFLYCSQECKDTHESEALAKRLKQMETHDPAVRRPKTEGELRAMGLILRPIASNDGGTRQELAQPKRMERKKGIRICGKCKQPGHNARTCDRQKRREIPRMGVPDQIATVTGLPVIERPKQTLAAPKPIGERPTGRLCGKCKQPGHNARTCKRGQIPNQVSTPTLSGPKKQSKPTQYKCGKCNEFGHNARTCKKK